MSQRQPDNVNYAQYYDGDADIYYDDQNQPHFAGYNNTTLDPQYSHPYDHGEAYNEFVNPYHYIKMCTT